MQGFDIERRPHPSSLGTPALALGFCEPHHPCTVLGVRYEVNPFMCMG